MLSDSNTADKTFFLSVDFNINLHDFERNEKVQCFVNLLINKPNQLHLQ